MKRMVLWGGATLAVATTIAISSCGSDGPSNTGGTAAAAGAGGTAGAGGSAGTSGGGDGGGLFNFDAGMGSDGSIGEDAACAASSVAAKLIPANILFVIDRSGSMNCNPPPLQSSPQCEQNPVPKFPDQATKWQIVRDALKAAIGSMTPATRVGISYFNNDDYCGVTQQPAVALAALDTTQIDALKLSIDGVTPKGATPIIGGTTLGYAHLFYDDKTAGNDFVVLLTDGAETCAPTLKETMINQTVPDAASVNIRTFVIGAPGSEPARAFLSQIAWAGGTAGDLLCTHDAMPEDVGNCHFDMTDPNLDFATSLNAALKQISGQALSCEFDVPPAVGGDIDYNQVNVSFTPSNGMTMSILQDNLPCDAGANGWQYNADKSKIVLCGNSCAMVKADAQGAISIALGCATEVAQ